MKRIVCAIYDNAVQSFGQPIFVVHRGLAMRSFMDEVNRKGEGNSLAAHPEDYSLHVLGTYDDEKGTFENLETPERLMRGADVPTKE